MIISKRSVKIGNVIAYFTTNPGIIFAYTFSDTIYTSKYKTILLELNFRLFINIQVFTRNPPLK